MRSTFRKIKLELFYIKELIRRRFPLVYYWNYFKNRYFGMYLLRRMPVWKCQAMDDFEVHVLSQKQGLWMAYWAIRSFMQTSGLCPKIVLHDDGTIDRKTALLFESKFTNIKVIMREDADRLIGEMPDVPEKIKRYRMGSNILILLFTDIFLLSNAKTVMLLDSDILFYQKPQEIIDFVNGVSKTQVLTTLSNKQCPLDVDDVYARKYRLIERKADYVISGIIVYRKGDMPLERFIEYFDHTLKPEGHFIEQAGWASLVTQLDYRFLDYARYPVKGLSDTVVAKHFTTPRRYELYARGIEKVRKSTL